MKLWGGRFAAGKRDSLFEKFSESFSRDQRLILYDLRVNQVYVRHLGAAGVLNSREVRQLNRGLESLQSYVQSHPRWAQGQSSEDVHTWVEARLERESGAVARKLRTGRSRNDLVATESRLFTKDVAFELMKASLALMESLAGVARKHLDVVMPGFTHLQPAQPILFSHYLLAYFEMFLRDFERFALVRTRADELPLGAGALAGTAFPLNRDGLARQLGFARVARNSLDATSDRDFVCELLFACTLAMNHLSRIAEDVIIYSSPAFGYVELDNRYATGSSLMPQKKNPDSLELIRGKAAGALGRLTGMLALLKGLPLAYNRDLQEDKQALFEGADAARDSLQLAARIVETLRVNRERMRAATEIGFLTATDIADELVRRGVPFGEAHERVGELVRLCVARKKTLAEITHDEARRIIPSWDGHLARVAASAERSVERRKATGGTARVQVSRQIRWAGQTISQLRKKISSLS